MLEIYDRAAKLKPPYRATRFREMVKIMGGRLQQIDYLVSEDFRRVCELFELGPENLKLTVEYLVLKPRWSPLFTGDQLSMPEKGLLKLIAQIYQT